MSFNFLQAGVVVRGPPLQLHSIAKGTLQTASVTLPLSHTYTYTGLRVPFSNLIPVGTWQGEETS